MKKSFLDNIPNNISEILRANKIQKKVSKIGFEYKNNIECLNKVTEEVNELRIEIQKNNLEKIKEELGDLIFACLDVSRKFNLNPEVILKKSNSKFIKRWLKLEKLVKEDKKKINELNKKKFQYYWQIAKN